MIVDACRKGREYHIEFLDFDSLDPYEGPWAFKSTSRDKIIKEVLSYIRRELNEQFNDTRDNSSPHII